MSAGKPRVPRPAELERLRVALALCLTLERDDVAGFEVLRSSLPFEDLIRGWSVRSGPSPTRCVTRVEKNPGTSCAASSMMSSRRRRSVGDSASLLKPGAGTTGYRSLPMASPPPATPTRG